MFLINLYRYLFGYVEIIVFGEFSEKILNLFAVNRIKVWDIERKENKILLKLSINDFKNMRKIRGKSKLHIKIKNKCGLIFLIKKYIKRIGIPVGILIFFLTLYVLSLFVWNITVNGNFLVSSAEILKCCDELGIKNGVLLSSVDSQLLREKLLLKCDRLSWCSFNIEGSKITVNVSEISKSSDDDIPSNIVSDYDCIITDIFAQSGVVNVTKGQAVTKGELLVSGIYDANGVNKFVKAKAEIKAEIIENITVSGNFSVEKYEENGKIKNKYVLDFFGLKIPLYFGKICDDYNEKLIIKNLYFFTEKMPIKLYKKSFYLLETSKYIYTRDELLEKLICEMEEKIDNLSNESEILSRSIREEKEKLILEYSVKYKKNIGLEEKLIFNVSN